MPGPSFVHNAPAQGLLRLLRRQAGSMYLHDFGDAAQGLQQ